MSLFDKQAPISGYTDYKFEKVGEIRRNRYLDNFYNSQAISEAAAQLQVAPLENDQQYRTELLKSTDAALNAIAEAGDYENLTIAVGRTSSNYNKRAAGLQRNLVQYNAFKEQMDKLSEKGNLDAENAAGTMAIAIDEHNKKGGLQMDEAGRASNFFQGIDIVQTPDIPKMIRETLSGIVADAQSIEYSETDGQYRYVTKEGIQVVPPDRVQRAMQMVMQDPRVVQYFDRMGEIRTRFLDDNQLAKKYQDNIAFGNQKITEIDEALANQPSLGRSQKEGLQATRDMYVNSIGQMQAILDTGDTALMRQRAKEMEIERMNDMYTDSAIAKFSYRQTEQSKVGDWDKLFLKSLKNKGANTTSDIAMLTGVSGQLQQNVAPSGVTIQQKRQHQRGLIEQENVMRQEGYFDDLGKGLTYDTVLSMSAADFVTFRGGQATQAEIDMFNRMRNGVLALEGEKAALKRLIEEAGEATGQTPEVRAQIAMDSDDRVPGMLKAIQTKYKVDAGTALNYLRSYLNETVARASADPGEDPKEYGRFAAWAFGYDYEMLHNSSTPTGFRSFMQQYITDAGLNEYTTSDMMPLNEFFGGGRLKIHRILDDAMELSDAQLTEYIEGQSTRQFTPTTYVALPGMTDDDMKVMDRLFKGAGPHALGEAFVSKETGELVSFDQLIAEDPRFKGAEPTTVSRSATQTGTVRYNPANPGLQGATADLTYEYTLQGGEKGTLSAQVPLSVIDNPAINRYLGSISNQFLRQAAIQYNEGVANPIVIFEGPNGQRFRYQVEFDKKIITPLDGPRAGMSMDMDTALSDPNSGIPALAKTGGKIVAY